MVFLFLDATFTWKYPASVNFTQGQTAKLVWSVNLTTDDRWDMVKIYRQNETNARVKETVIMASKNDDGKLIFINKMSARANDIDLNVQGEYSIIVTLYFRNLRATDEKYYRLIVSDNNNPEEERFIYLKVLGMYYYLF